VPKNPFRTTELAMISLPSIEAGQVGVKPYSLLKLVIRNHTGATFELISLTLDSGSVATGSDKFINAAGYGKVSVWEFDIYHQPRGRVDFGLMGDFKPVLSLIFNCRVNGDPHVTICAMPLGGYVNASLELVTSNDNSSLTALVNVNRREGGAFD